MELNCFPSAALDSHFGTLSFIRRIPESLKDRILVVIRTKPGLLGDNPILYRELCGFPLESLTFLDGFDFSQSVSVADCVVGINLPTSGYFEVLRKGVPLIHVQTADVISLQPDLPPEIVQRITELQGIWPTIEALLFDERQRRKILETQGNSSQLTSGQRFLAVEIPSTPVFRQLLGSRIRPTLNSFLSAIRQRIVRRLRPMRPSASLDESCLPCCQQGGAGCVDDVLLGSDGVAVTVGWAADMLIRQPAKAVHVFLHGLWMGKDSPWQTRLDVAVHFNDRRLEQSGFRTFNPGRGGERSWAFGLCRTA